MFNYFMVTIIILITVFKSHAEKVYQLPSCYEDHSFSNNSLYKQNLETTLSILPTTDTGLGFFIYSTGKGDDIANATALCRGGVVDPNLCLTCLNDLILRAPELCPNDTGAFLFNDDCKLNYFNKNLRMDFHAVFLESQHVFVDSAIFKARVLSFLTNILKVAASGNALQKFASGNTTVSNSTTIYGFVQCNPDLSREGCTQCMDGAINIFYGSNRNSDGAVGSVNLPTCNFWFSIKPYHTKSPDIISPPPSTEAGKNNTKTVVIVVVILTIFVIIIAFICIFLRITRRKKKNNENIVELSTRRMIQYDFDVLKLATNEFSDDAKLGRGGFGTVYRGNLEEKDIAIKRLQRSSGGEQEFKTEVHILGNVVHRNLVRLIGYCVSPGERLLVYEYLPNGSLDQFISDPSKLIQLDWNKRFNILIGIVNGLVYLHRDCHPQIVHRDLKPGNILLDEVFEAKIADFGLATLFTHGEFERHTGRAVGTYGYMPPEYIARGHYSEKMDVYSFGVMMLEIIRGQMRRTSCNSNGESIVSSAWGHWKKGTLNNVIDPLMKMEEDDSHQINKCVNIGLLCVQENDGARPTSTEVARMLDNCNQNISSPLPNITSAPVDSPLLNVSDASSSTSSYYYTLTNE